MPTWSDPVQLLGAWEATADAMRPSTFLLSYLFSDRYFSDTEEVALDQIGGHRVMSSFSAVDGEGKTLARVGYETKSWTPPALKPNMIVRQPDLFKRLPGERIGGELSADQRAVALKQKDLLVLYGANMRRREWQAGQLLFGASVAMTGDDYQYTLEFTLDTKETLLTTALWSAASTAKPLDDLDKWADSVAEKSGIEVTDCIMGRLAVRAFMNTAQVIAESTKQANRLLAVDPMPAPQYKGATKVGTFRTPMGRMITIWTYSELYDSVTSAGVVTSTPIIPEKQVALFNPTDSFLFAFGAYVDMGQDQPYLFRGEDYPREYMDVKANVRYLEMISRPLPLPKRNNGWFWATVLS